MVVTAKDLRFNVSMLFDMLSKGKDITITYRGKAKAKLISVEDEKFEKKSDAMFGMWKDKDVDVESYIREARRGRDFAI